VEQNIGPGGKPPHSWLGAPFYLDDLAGAVVVQSYDEVVYTEKDKELMAFVARHLGDALKQKRAVEALELAKDRAEQAEKNMSTFLANMSHEIRTPMNGIIGLTDLLLKSDITGHQRTYMELIHSSADRLLKLINDILDFSKIEAGKLELNITSFSLRSTIADALEILAITAAKKNIAMVVDCHQNIADQLMGDADKLHQILVNLVGNAVKFTNQGSVTLAVRPAGEQLGANNHIDLRFQVKDTGIGIPEAEISNVFKSFRQLGTTRDSNHRGTGLGLVIAAELVEMMGGKICVESNPGVGTTFYFSARFPLAPPHPEDQLIFGKTSSPLPRTQRSLRILLVEDEYINRTLAVSVLEREGWEVVVAENGLQALKLLNKEGFDLILMDIQMPELNGYETTLAIRQKEQGTDWHIPIIAMTAYAVKGDREKCLAAGMDGYVSKPMRPDRLREEIETVLQHHANPS
jgi:signal transduction histidine kinase/CheY-like chemotaxis protein